MTRKERSMATKRTSKQEEAALDTERLMAILNDQVFKKACARVLKTHFPRYDTKAEKDKDSVLMDLLHRDAADQFLAYLKDEATPRLVRRPITPKQLKR